MKVRLIAYTQLSDSIQAEPEHPLHWHNAQCFDADIHGDSDISDQDAIIEYAGRTCYNSIDKMYKSPDFVQKRLQQGHGDIAEHVNFVFQVEGISVACLGQMVRHGLMSHSVESTRYVDQRASDVVWPASIREVFSGDLYARVNKHFNECYDLYEALREAGVPKEDARYVLPVSNQTKLVVSGNALMWRNFIAQRSHKAAQWEVASVAVACFNEMVKVAPKTFEDLTDQVNEAKKRYGLE